MMKTCTKCKDDKPLSEFYKQKEGKYGVTSTCKACCREKGKKYYQNNKESHNRTVRVCAVKRKYGLTEEEFDNLKYVCSICGATEGKLVIDHNHATGKFRGVLCNTCNAGIGFLKDDLDIVLKAYNYLKANLLEGDNDND